MGHETARASPRLRKIGARLLLLIVGATVSFALCEVGFRVFESIQLARAGEVWAVFDEKLGWRPNPRFGDHNADGLRDRPVTPKAGRSRILFLGDSVLYYGDGVDDTLVGHLRGNLDGAVGKDAVDVVNAGVKGYTNWQELVFLKERGLVLEPDLVGVGFVLNDCFHILHQFRVEDGKIVGQNYRFSEEVGGGESLLEHSHFLSWLAHRLWRRPRADAGGYSFEKRPDFRTAWRDDRWADIESQLREMADLGRTNRFRVFLVAFPLADQYQADYLARDREHVLKPQRKLAEICGRLAIPYLDLFPVLVPAEDMESDGIHLTKRGRAKAAARIAEFLEAEKLVVRR